MQELWLKIGRIPRDEFILIHIGTRIPFLFAYCVLGIIAWGNRSAEPILIIPYLLSNLFLAKRFQDCGICGIRGFIFGLGPIVLFYMLSIFGLLDMLGIIPMILQLLYPLVSFIMCFIKGNPGPNKYGNPV